LVLRHRFIVNLLNHATVLFFRPPADLDDVRIVCDHSTTPKAQSDNGQQRVSTISMMRARRVGAPSG